VNESADCIDIDLHGMMHGEAIRMRDEGQLKEQTFDFV
jgi:hypothetical protein